MSKMVEMVEVLGRTSSTNEKMGILKKYVPNNQIISEALKLCYNPFIVSNMKKIPIVKRNGLYTFEEAFYRFKALYENLNIRSVSGKAALLEVSNFLEEVNKEAQSIFVNILKKDLRVKIGATLINNALGEGFIPQFEVQLAHKYIPNKVYKNIQYWFGSPKLNGFRGYFDMDNGLRTRKGHKFFGFDHIVKELEVLSKRYSLNFTDGEIFDIGIPFSVIQSYASKRKNIVPEHKEKLKFNLFAVGSDDIRETFDMINIINGIDWSNFHYVKPVDYFIVKNEYDVIYNKMLSMYDLGFEGLMLRNPKISYVFKRSNDLLKAKPFKESSFVIVGFEEGAVGKATEGTLGAIIVDGIVDGKKIRCGVGSGFKMIGKEAKVSVHKGEITIIEDGMITRDLIWKNKDIFIGKPCEIQYQSITDEPDSKTGLYSLNFPVFVPPKFEGIDEGD